MPWSPAQRSRRGCHFSRARAVCGAALVVCALLVTTVAAASSGPPKLFLSCPQGCFEDYLRQELSYFDLVRDRHQAEWTLFIVRQATGNGGERLTVTVFPRAQSLPPSQRRQPSSRVRVGEVPRVDASEVLPELAPQIVRELITPPGTSLERQRRELLERVLEALYIGLLPTEHARAFRLELPGRDGVALSSLEDPWDYWVITPQIYAAGNVGRRSYSGYFELGLNLRRITEQDKLMLYADYGRELKRFVLEDGRDVRGNIRNWEFTSQHAHSVGTHWAIGSTFQVEGVEYENLAAHTHLGPVVEFNVFPYTQNATDLLTFSYQAGVWTNWYEKPTIFGRTRELRPYHALAVITDLNQPWGSVQLGTQLNSFIDQPEQLRLRGVAETSLQLFEGFALTLALYGSWIRDQISLRAEQVSDVDLLLGTQQLPSDFSVSGELIFSYAFGSIHNTIVNPRFGRLDLD